MKFIVYDNEGKFINHGHCQDRTFHKQGGENGFVFEGCGNDVTQKIEFDGLDDEGQPINPRIVDKTSEEVEIDNPKTKDKPFKKRRANITNEQLQDILGRLHKLEAKKVDGIL